MVIFNALELHNVDFKHIISHNNNGMAVCRICYNYCNVYNMFERAAACRNCIDQINNSIYCYSHDKEWTIKSIITDFTKIKVFSYKYHGNVFDVFQLNIIDFTFDQLLSHKYLSPIKFIAFIFGNLRAHIAAIYSFDLISDIRRLIISEFITLVIDF